MINLVDEKFVFPDWEDVALIKTEAVFKTYGNKFDFASVYEQTDQNGCLTAVVGRLDGGINLSLTETADVAELENFVAFLKPSQIFCQKIIFKNKSFKIRNVDCFVLENKQKNVPANKAQISVSELYNRLSKCQNQDISLPSFENWYPDFCVRKNHDTADYIGDENCVAMCGYKTEKSAIISGIATDLNKRNKGFGGRVLGQMVSVLGGRKIYALTSLSGEFYIKCGFKKTNEKYYLIDMEIEKNVQLF